MVLMCETKVLQRFNSKFFYKKKGKVVLSLHKIVGLFSFLEKKKKFRDFFKTSKYNTFNVSKIIDNIFKFFFSL